MQLPSAQHPAESQPRGGTPGDKAGLVDDGMLLLLRGFENWAVALKRVIPLEL